MAARLGCDSPHLKERRKLLTFFCMGDTFEEDQAEEDGTAARHAREAWGSGQRWTCACSPCLAVRAQDTRENISIDDLLGGLPLDRC